MFTELAFDAKNLAKIVETAVETILKGGCIIYPTDTVYGLGVDSTNQKAVEKIFELKGRKEGRGIASIFQSIEQIKRFCKVNEGQEKILRRYLPGPYTFLLKPRLTSQLAGQLVDRERGTVGVRIPNHTFTKSLAKHFNNPFTTTSANISGLPSPKTPPEVEGYLLKPNDLSLRGVSTTTQSRDPSVGRQRSPRPADGGDRDDILLIDAGPLAGIPSTVVDLTKTPPEVVRQGAGEWLSL